MGKASEAAVLYCAKAPRNFPSLYHRLRQATIASAVPKASSHIVPQGPALFSRTCNRPEIMSPLCWVLVRRMRGGKGGSGGDGEAAIAQHQHAHPMIYHGARCWALYSSGFISTWSSRVLRLCFTGERQQRPMQGMRTEAVLAVMLVLAKMA